MPSAAWVGRPGNDADPPAPGVVSVAGDDRQALWIVKRQSAAESPPLIFLVSRMLPTVRVLVMLHSATAPARRVTLAPVRSALVHVQALAAQPGRGVSVSAYAHGELSAAWVGRPAASAEPPAPGVVSVTGDARQALWIVKRQSAVESPPLTFLVNRMLPRVRVLVMLHSATAPARRVTLAPVKSPLVHVHAPADQPGRAASVSAYAHGVPSVAWVGRLSSCAVPPPDAIDIEADDAKQLLDTVKFHGDAGASPTTCLASRSDVVTRALVAVQVAMAPAPKVTAFPLRLAPLHDQPVSA